MLYQVHHVRWMIIIECTKSKHYIPIHAYKAEMNVSFKFFISMQNIYLPIEVSYGSEITLRSYKRNIIKN